MAAANKLRDDKCFNFGECGARVEAGSGLLPTELSLGFGVIAGVVDALLDSSSNSLTLTNT